MAAVRMQGLMLFSGRVALVTGAASGIGEACARKLAGERAAVVIADVDVDNGERVAATIRGEAGACSFFKTDVSSAEQVRAVVEHAVATYGGLHVA